jgi:hypothetical protein
LQRNRRQDGIKITQRLIKTVSIVRSLCGHMRRRIARPGMALFDAALISDRANLSVF